MEPQPIYEHEFYGVVPELLSKEFIAGLIVGGGTFFWTKSGSKKIPVFSLRMHVRDFDLLINIKYSLNLKEKIYEYTHSGRHYAFLIVRNTEGLNIVINDIYPRLAGHKKLQFIKWFSRFNDESLERRYKMIYSKFKSKFPELYSKT